MPRSESDIVVDSQIVQFGMCHNVYPTTWYMLAQRVSHVSRRFLQVFYFILMCRAAQSRILTSIANLIGERGEMAKQPLPIFICPRRRRNTKPFCRRSRIGMSSCQAILI